MLREVMNTVGKKGKLGEQVRCVVSVAMLTEGWDANTVTHILGIRAFRSQLLCEQVVGRGLRRRSYAANDDDRFEPEYAEVYGVPFAFIPSDVEMKEPPPKPPAVEVYAVADRADRRITFPKLDGYRIEMPDQLIDMDIASAAPYDLEHARVATKSEVAPLVGESAQHTIDDVRSARPQAIAYAIAKCLIETELVVGDGDQRPWLFPRIVDSTRRWVEERVVGSDERPKGLLLFQENTRLAAEHLAAEVITTYGSEDGRERVIQPILRRFDPEGSTDDVYFTTRKATIETTKSHVNRVTLDGAPDGNTWEQIVAMALEASNDVHCYVKNDRLGFTIPYLHKGVSHEYVPDFLVRLKLCPGDVERTLIVEVSGGQKSPGPTKEKATTAQFRWCAAVNNHGGWGRWGFTEITEMPTAETRLADAIENLYADGTVTGLRDLGD